MYTANSGTPDAHRPSNEQAEEEVERRLAQYVFVREERDREVRLLFRDVPAPDLVLTFRAAGATLLSISGERIRTGPPTSSQPSAVMQTDETEGDTSPEQGDGRPSQRRKRRQPLPPPPSGELVMRYFFALGETVYTVNLASPAGVVGSVAGIYPAARLAEEELRKRLNVIFT